MSDSMSNLTSAHGRRAASRSAASFWEQVGGRPTFEKLVRAFYDGVRTDEVLLPMYPEQPDLEGAIQRLTGFLEQYWGGPGTYSEERGHPRLRMRHMPFAVTADARDRWLRHMRAAVDTLELSPAARGDALGLPRARRPRDGEQLASVSTTSGGSMPQNADVIVIGAGLAGLVAVAELVEAGQHVIVLEQEPEASLGGQAHWSFGGLFLVDSPEQRRMGIKDSHDLARQDWYASAEFDRDEDENAREWAEAYLAFAAGEKRDWLRSKGIKFFPVVGWAERGGYTATGHGNSVPRFHIVWGTGPAILEPFIKTVREGVAAGPRRAEVPPPRRRADRAQGRRRRCEGRDPRSR